MAELISVKDGRKPINGECVLVIRRASLGSLAYGLKHYHADRFNPWDDWGRMPDPLLGESTTNAQII